MGFSGKTGTVGWSALTRNFDDPKGLYEHVDDEESGDISEVVGWTAEYAVRLTSYPHSESEGWDDVAIGSRSFRGTVDIKLRTEEPLWSLKYYGVVSLHLENAAVSFVGQAVIESMPFSTKIEGGEPVSASFRWRSKLEWYMPAGSGDDGNS